MAKQKTPRECQVCGDTFFAVHARHVNCSPRCRETFKERRKQARRKQERRANIRTVLCGHCGQSLETSDPRHKYCSYECQYQAYRERSRTPRRVWVCGYCRECGKSFVTSGRRRGRTCSVECSKRWANRVRSTALPNRPCKQCGKEFDLPYGSRGQRFCSDLCRRRWKNKQKRDSTNHRKRARKYGVAYEPINLIKVFERDGWICGICNDPIDPAVPWPDDRSKSLDHIVPMSKGGGHVWSNVQAAHLGCNVDKADRMGDAL